MAENRTIHKYQAGDLFHDRYQLVHLIGTGGFADVWSALDIKTGNTVALKVYCRLEEDGCRNLIMEFNSVHELNHTNILRSDHMDRWTNVPYLTMKLCKGGSLAQRIGTVGADEALRIIRDMASGLSYLHDNSMVHQDIKPANILVDFNSNGDYYLLSDFGISARTRKKLTASVGADTEKHTAMTEQYAPPEKFSKDPKDRRPDPKGDIFSLGITMYELVTGHLPFDNIPAGLNMVYGNATVDFSEISDPRVRLIVMRCMRRDKDERPTAYALVNISDYMYENPQANEYAFSQIDWNDADDHTPGHEADQTPTQTSTDKEDTVFNLSRRHHEHKHTDVAVPLPAPTPTETPMPSPPAPTAPPVPAQPAPATELPSQTMDTPPAEQPRPRTPKDTVLPDEVPAMSQDVPQNPSPKITQQRPPQSPTMQKTQIDLNAGSTRREPAANMPPQFQPQAPKTRLITNEKPAKKGISILGLIALIIGSAIVAFVAVSLILRQMDEREVQSQETVVTDVSAPAVMPGAEELVGETIEAISESPQSKK